MNLFWVANRRLRNTVISPFTIIFRSCSLLFTHYIYHIVTKNRRTKYFYVFLQMMLVSSLKGSGKLLSKAQNSVRASVSASRSLKTMFRVYTINVRPSGSGQHVKQPQKSASHDIATNGIFTALRMMLLDQSRRGTWSQCRMPLACSTKSLWRLWGTVPSHPTVEENLTPGP